MPEFVTVTLSEKGQLVLPKHLRVKFQLEKGSKLVVFEEKGKIILESASGFLQKAQESETRRNMHAGLHEQANPEAHLHNHAAVKPRDIKEAREIH